MATSPLLAHEHEHEHEHEHDGKHGPSQISWSDNVRIRAFIVPDPVMAEQISHNVVINDKSVIEQSATDVNANPQNTSTAPAGDITTAQTTPPPPPPPTNPAHTSDPSSIPAASASSNTPASGSPTKPASTPVESESRSNGVLHRNINGDIEGHSSVEDGLVTDNVGSDTDTSRAGSVDQFKDSTKPGASGLKKPTSFKPVSVTKAFLAKTATSAPSTAKLGDKSPTMATLQPVAKPRLVAKSGSGLRDIPRARPGDSAGAPGVTVWNKNQPTPTPPPKQFTDEELKQQYGIHLANRIQEDASDGRSKWADIDDDEEDWAPETLEWMDGTKSTVNTAESPAPEPEPVKLAEPKPEEPKQPPMLALKKPGATTTTTSTTTTTKTILRPGAARQSGLSPKGASEKPTLVAKGPAPAPSKSPWAPLPPVEKVSPIMIQPPPQQQAQQHAKFAHRDAHGFDTLAQPSPAREIAADTFDRSWRDSERGTRELFNSQSGRYEPASEYRKGGARHQEPLNRQPAVLQRPPPPHSGSAGPAEPSAAFQTRSSAQMDGAQWGRRRGSSVSGGNMPFERRMSVLRPPDAVLPVPVPELDTHTKEVRAGVVAAGGHDTGVPPPPPPQTSLPQDDQPTIAQPEVAKEPPVPVEDEYTRQKRIMREKREAAQRRRQEEEAREEAERKERIRKKLEALGMPPEKQPSAAPSPSPAPAESDMMKPKAEPLPSVASPPDTAAALKQHSVPEPSKANVQVTTAPSAHASPVQHVSSQKERTFGAPPPPFLQPQGRPGNNSFDEPQLPGLKQHSPNMPNRTPYQRQPSSQALGSSAFSSPGDRKAQPTRISSVPSANTFGTWAGNGMATHPAPSSNVWGPPSNNRHIHVGNGTFDSAYPKIPAGQMAKHQTVPFSASTPFERQYAPSSTRISPQAFGPPGSPMQPPPFEQQLGQMSALDNRINNDAGGASQINGTSPMADTARPAYQPAPIAPPQKAASRMQGQTKYDPSGWNDFAAQAQHREAESAMRLKADIAKDPAPQPRWTETFKQTGINDNWLGGSREVLKTETILHGDASREQSSMMKPAAPPVTETSSFAANPQPVVPGRPSAVPESTVRLPAGPSSFGPGSVGQVGAGRPGVRLPAASQAANMQPLPPTPSTPAAQQSRFFPSALYCGSPPPEEEDHPVHGDARSPLVKLPAPKPKVKLPAAPHTRQSRVIMPPRAPSFGAQPLVTNRDWQARFNGLFGKAEVTNMAPPSPPKTPEKPQAPAPAVAPSSRFAMDFNLMHNATTVSLPQRTFQASRFEIMSKPRFDDVFEGELSFGFTPKVSLPRGVRYREPLADSRTGRMNSKFNNRAVESSSKGLDPISEYPKNNVIVIKVPMMATAKEVLFTRKSRPNQRRNASNRFESGKRNASGSVTATSSPGAAPTPARQNGSRKSSYQKTQSPAAGESASKAGPAANSAAKKQDGSNRKDNTPWQRTEVPKGKNRDYKPYQHV